MGRRKVITVLAAAMAVALPSSAGPITLFSAQPTPTDAGTFAGGTVLSVTITGAISLDGPGGIITNPDGSLSFPPNQTPAQCSACYAPGYGYFMHGAPYPDGHGGMTYTNTFQGGGSNYDMYPGGGGNPSNFAPYGNQTVDPSAPNVIRFGAVAYTFVPDLGSMSGLQPMDWHLLGAWTGSGYGGTFVVPGSGLEHLMVVVSDTYYPNNIGTYTIDAEIVPMPEPAATGLVFAGLLVLGRVQARRRSRRA